MRQDPNPATVSAVTTNHFALQAGLGTATTEASTRASLYLYSLSAMLIATGFIIQSRDAFVPFITLALPALSLIGLVTVVRLVDISLEVVALKASIARTVAWYATFSSDAHTIFGHPPEIAASIGATPALRFGPFIGGLTTIAAMIACVNSIVAAAGLSLLLHSAGIATAVALAAGASLGLALIALFYAYQTWRLRETVEQSASDAQE